MSNFAFLKAEWPDLHDAASRAEAVAYPDVRTACFRSRRGLEVMVVHWLYRHDDALRMPYQDNLSALLHEPTFKTTAGAAVFARTVLIDRLGNQAVHEGVALGPLQDQLHRLAPAQPVRLAGVPRQLPVAPSVGVEGGQMHGDLPGCVQPQVPIGARRLLLVAPFLGNPVACFDVAHGGKNREKLNGQFALPRQVVASYQR